MQPLPVPTSATRRPAALSRDRATTQLHQQLGVGVGHEDCRRHLEIERHELLVADHVGDRLAVRPARHLRAIDAELRLRKARGRTGGKGRGGARPSAPASMTSASSRAESDPCLPRCSEASFENLEDCRNQVPLRRAAARSASLRASTRARPGRRP